MKIVRYLGIDLGRRRIGLAVGDSDSRIASPLETIRPTDINDALRRLVEFASEYGVDEWVVGLPLNMDGSEGPQAKETRAFADQLAARNIGPVHLWDERLSSYAADERMAQTGLTHAQKARRRDALAAQEILQSFLDAQ